MTLANQPKNNIDDLKLIREGSSQKQRLPKVLDSREDAFPLSDEHDIANRIVFAQAYSKYLKFFDHLKPYDTSNNAKGNWQPFFSQDLSVFLSVAAVQDVDGYRSTIKEHFDFLKDITNRSDEEKSKNYLGFLFSSVGTLAQQLDILKEGLPADIQLKTILQNQIKNQLAPAFKKLLLYYRDGQPPNPDAPYLNDVALTFHIMGVDCSTFKNISEREFSTDWIAADDATSWNDYLGNLSDLLKYPATGIYGNISQWYKRINHIATHSLFTSIFDQFLRVYAHTVIEAGNALKKTFTKYDSHQPHYALFLAFLILFEYARKEANTLTQRHLDFYYREILRLKEKDIEPSKAHLLIELAKNAPPHMVKTGELFKAGKDDLGREAFFASDRDFAANQAKITSRKTVYRHENDSIKNTLSNQNNNIFASPEARSDDGLGAELTSPDQSWHPFHNKVYKDGKLAEIKMPEAEIGFAIASHYLLMAGGERTVEVEFTPVPDFNFVSEDFIFLFTTEKGWLEKTAEEVTEEQESGTAREYVATIPHLRLKIKLDGGDPAVVPYSAEVHGYKFDTDLPVLLVKLRHRADSDYIYSKLKDVKIKFINMKVSVEGLKVLAISNDSGPVDTSKPFQPFGAIPKKHSALIIGSKEVFQKSLASASVNLEWLDTPDPRSDIAVYVGIDFLKAGKWSPVRAGLSVKLDEFSLTQEHEDEETPNQIKNIVNLVVDSPDLTPNEFYSPSATYGFARLKLKVDYGYQKYQSDLVQYIAGEIRKPGDENNIKPEPFEGPTVTELSMKYETGKQKIDLASTDKSTFEERQARFFHIAPFGQAEQHPYLKNALKGVDVPDKKVYLLPQLKHTKAEFYLGITGLTPPQNLALFFQVADGTADPLIEKPPQHIRWSYLVGNEWIPFRKEEVEDTTGGLINSGIITFAVPRYATKTNMLMPSDEYWIRGAIESHPDAVCRLLMAAAQGLEVTFLDKDNDPTFPTKVLPPGTISKLDKPVSAVKQVTQPYETFGGRGKETTPAYYTRISERLRHKDRAITLWDYERLVLEAFPAVYKVKCLNHTQYEPDGTGTGIYRELAAGHITVVVIANQEFQKLHDPLRPYASLGLLEEIEAFLRERLSCFVTPHVKNPEFEEVAVSCNVCFKKDADETYSLKEMDKAIIQFLSPWAFPGGGSPSFGGKIYKSTLINFVEDLPYVDYVTDFILTHKFLDLNNEPDERQGDEVEGSKAVSVLVSARTHTGIISI